MASRVVLVECSFDVRSDLIEKTAKRLCLLMSLLVIADIEENYGLAYAIYEIINWQMREIMIKDSEDESEGRPFEYNFWETLIRGCEREELLEADKAARMVLVRGWNAGGDQRKMKKIRAMGRIEKIGEIIDIAVTARNEHLLLGGECPDEELRGLLAEAKYYSGTGVTKEIRKDVKLDEKERLNCKTTGCPREIYLESKKVLEAATITQKLGSSEYLEELKGLYERWIEMVFKFYHSKKGVEKLSVISMPTQDYTSLKKVLLSNNVFEEVGKKYERPTGSYSKAKESDYYVALFFHWRMCQSLYDIHSLIDWKVDLKDRLTVQITVMHIFCSLCKAATNFCETKKVVEGYRASPDKVKYLSSLNTCEKDYLNTFNQTTLSLFRLPHVTILEVISTPKEEKKNVEDRVSRLLTMYSGSPLFTIFKETEKRVKKMDCSERCFRRQLVDWNKEEIQRFEEATSLVGIGERNERRPTVFPNHRTEDFEKDLSNILRHYLRLPSDS